MCFLYTIFYILKGGRMNGRQLMVKLVECIVISRVSLEKNQSLKYKAIKNQI